MPCSSWASCVRLAAQNRPDAIAPTVLSTGGPQLLVSNSPENVTQGDLDTSATLLRFSSATAGTNSYRCYAWHVNSTGSTKWLHLSGAAPASATVSNIRYSHGVAVANSVNLRALGECLAKCQVNFFDYDVLEVSGAKLSSDEKIIWSVEVPNGHFIGALIEFDVDVDLGDYLYLRTSFSPDDGLTGTYLDPMAPLDNHVRGSWPYSLLLLDCGTHDVKPLPNQTSIAEFGCCESDGPEELQFPGFGLWTENKGLYGVDLVYRFTLTKSGDQTYPAFVSLHSRGTGEPYFGAAQAMTPPTSRFRGGIGPIGGTNGNVHFVRLLHDPGTNTENASRSSIWRFQDS